MNSKLKIIHDATTKALEELPNFPCRMDEMSPREQQIADVVTRLCGTIQFIRYQSENYTATSLTHEDVHFLVWALGWIEGRFSKTPPESVDAAQLNGIISRCHEIWPKLSDLL